MEEIYAHLDDPSIRPKLREKLEAGRQSAELSYDLATIRCNAPIDFVPQDGMIQEPDRKALYDLFVKLEFVKLMDRYQLREAAQVRSRFRRRYDCSMRNPAGSGDALRLFWMRMERRRLPGPAVCVPYRRWKNARLAGIWTR